MSLSLRTIYVFWNVTSIIASIFVTTANIIAGHLLLTLLSNTGINIPNYLVIILIIIQILLLILESAVAVIQSYVISILRTLYSREVN